MAVFHHLVVATDLGECSQGAVDVATQLAVESGAALTLVHVMEVPAYAYAGAPEQVVDLFTPLREAAEAGLNEALTAVKAKLPAADAVLSRGTAWSELLEIARQKGADLIVLGTHGHQGVARVVLGSVAEKVVRMSPVPVLTVRATPAKSA
jgi:nucleotide-binding universal stress UspA family protein